MNNEIAQPPLLYVAKVVLDYVAPVRRRHDDEGEKIKYQRVAQRYPTMIPVIVETNNLRLAKNRFLIAPDYTAANFQSELRRHAPTLLPGEALFLFIDDRGDHILAPLQMSMRDLYFRYRCVSGFLHIVATTENTFG